MESALRVAAYVFYGLVAFLLVGAILIQESRGGGLAALGGTRAETAFGASNPVRRLTVVLAVIFFLLAGFMGWWLPRGEKASQGKRITAPEEPGAAPAVPRTPAGEPAAEAEEEPAPPPGETEPTGSPGAETGEPAEEPAAAPAGP